MTRRNRSANRPESWRSNKNAEAVTVDSLHLRLIATDQGTWYNLCHLLVLRQAPAHISLDLLPLHDFPARGYVALRFHSIPFLCGAGCRAVGHCNFQAIYLTVLHDGSINELVSIIMSAEY